MASSNGNQRIQSVPNYDVRSDFNLRDILYDLADRIEILETGDVQSEVENISQRVCSEKLNVVYDKISDITRKLDSLTGGLKTLCECIKEIKREYQAQSEIVKNHQEQLELCQDIIREHVEGVERGGQDQGPGQDAVDDGAGPDMETGETTEPEPEPARLSVDQINELKSFLHRQRYQKDEYWMKTILITGIHRTYTDADVFGGTLPIDDTRLSYYDRIKKMLRYCGLGDLIERSHKFYLTSTGNIRLTFLDSRDAARNLMFAKRQLKLMQGSKVKVQRMVPVRMLSKKKALLTKGDVLKRSGQISSYDVVMKDSTCKLRVFCQQTRVIEFLDLDTEIQIAENVVQMGENIMERNQLEE